MKPLAFFFRFISLHFILNQLNDSAAATATAAPQHSASKKASRIPHFKHFCFEFWTFSQFHCFLALFERFWNFPGGVINHCDPLVLYSLADQMF